VIKQVESELCIDTSKVVLEGFSQGAAMSWFLTGSRPGVVPRGGRSLGRRRAGHSGPVAGRVSRLAREPRRCPTTVRRRRLINSPR
jgi:poly(3-hydroxybutyrate) depolymerase